MSLNPSEPRPFRPRDAATALAKVLLANRYPATLPASWPPTKPDLARLDALENSALSSALAKVCSKNARPPRNTLRVALIDYHGKRSAFYEPNARASIGSLGKLAFLYAAFQLRDDVRRVATAKNTRTVQTLETELKAWWKTLKLSEALRSTRPVFPRVQRDNQAWFVGKSAAEAREATTNRTWLEHVFGLGLADKLTAGEFSSIDFDGMNSAGIASLKPSVDAGTLATIQTIGLRPHNVALAENWDVLATFPFAHRLWMTIAWSDNLAANTCAHDLGMAYVNELLVRSGLATSTNLHLWLTIAYANPPGGHHTRYRSPTVGHPSGIRAPVYQYTATARGMAALMAGIWDGTLIGQEDASDMKRLMRPHELVEDETLGGAPARILRTIEPHLQPSLADATMKGGLTEEAAGALSMGCDVSFFELGDGRRYGMVILDASGENHAAAEAFLVAAAADLWKLLEP